jgi:hypothetical protein
MAPAGGPAPRSCADLWGLHTTLRDLNWAVEDVTGSASNFLDVERHWLDKLSVNFRAANAGGDQYVLCAADGPLFLILKDLSPDHHHSQYFLVSWFYHEHL